MATAVSYPGVYIEEIASGVRTIAGVSTSTAAIVGYTRRGPTNHPVQIFSFADFERQFGGLSSDSPLSYAVSHFFLNGGTTAWIVRVASGAATAAITLRNGIGGGATPAIIVSARSGGLWGNNLRVVVDYGTANPGSLFNLTIVEMADRGGRLVPARTEVHRNLSMDSAASNYAITTVNSASALIELERDAGVTFGQNGVSDSAPLSAADLARLGDGTRRLAISLDGSQVYEFDIFGAGQNLAGGNFAALAADLAARIQAAVRALEPGNAVFSGFTCAATITNNLAVLRATSGTAAADREHSSVVFSNASLRNAAIVLRLGPANGGRDVSGAAAARPAPNGSAWLPLPVGFDFATLASPSNVTVDLIDPAGTVITTQTLALWATNADRPATLDQLRVRLETALRTVTARPEFAQAVVSVADGRIVATPGGENPSFRFNFTAGPQAGGADLTTNAEENIAAYQLGVGPTIVGQMLAVPGADGSPPNAVQLAGSRAAKSGLFALEDVDLFNILLLPNQSDPALLATAIAYAEERRAFIVIDLPETIDTLDEARGWLNATGTGQLRHRNAAAYFPRARMADPLQNNRVRSFANSGAVAGLYARTDGTRGVWKAPAGTEAAIRGAQGLDYLLTDAENGALNPLGLNCLRSFPAFGPIAWGARTLVGSDQAASEWKYVPVRRLALFLEESLYRGTQWVVFEPNDAPLWAQIRLNVGAFMHTLFRQGAFQGKTPKEAYLVQCDETTTTQDDINLGIVNIVVGFAPLKPAEFVIIKLQQLAGQAGAGA
jgi:phage tail sheath protein FI